MNHHKEIITLRKKREKESRARSILDAAKKVFFSKGYLKSTMDEIALEAEISKPTIYQYFKAKDELYYSLTLPVLHKMIADMEKMREKIDTGNYTSGKDIIKDNFRTYYDLFEQDPDTFRVFMIFQQTDIINEVNKSISTTINELARKRYQGMRYIYAKAIEQGLIKNLNVYHFVDTIWGTFQGIVQTLDIKSPGSGINKNLFPTLKFAENIFIESIPVK